MAEIVLINPRFEVSYWGMEHALPLLGKRANVPVAALPLLAALTPGEHRITLLDENVTAINYDRLATADIVGLTGMTVQRVRMREILAELKARGHFTVVGGPWVSVQEDYFDDLADVIFVGEAEETWPEFLRDWQGGRQRRRYEQAAKTDMTKVPTPRFDLLNMDHYLFGSVQFSRGCPFQCEFCDIIVTFGRRPRLKTSTQILAELEALRAQKIEIAFIVDDNLIGNKKAIKLLLHDLIAYQQANGYPFDFFTEASLDLAEDEELMQLMVQANIISVFVGIESPNEKSLRETRKFQNVRPAGTLVERVHRIQEAGIEVWCGMILGFDNDDASIFEAQRAFLKEARIPTAMIGMLSAIPKTPLHARLAGEGRLDAADEPEFGTNVIPLQMSREELRDGYVQVMRDLYEPDAYFERLEELYLKKRIRYNDGVVKYWRRHPWHWLKSQVRNAVTAGVLYWRLMHGVTEARLRREYRRRLRRFLLARPDPNLLIFYLFKCFLHYHQYTMTQQMALGSSKVYNSF
ncbi:MAG: B12-binding domain-containing radical SAM protein [Planctomycetota bacterium]|nr:MAG: B12-binding domain-containing radical SAM protein [Planctomycetota bacterium]